MVSKNIFIGKWMVVCLDCYVEENGWILLMRYPPHSFIWEFEASRQFNFASGEMAFEGKLSEHFPENLRETTDYAYYPSEHQLYVDRSDYAPDGFCNICINDRYHVEYIRRGEYWLYDFEDVEEEPEGYKFRIKIKRI